MSASAPLQLQQQQLILRLPDELAARVHVLIKEGQKSKSGPPSLLDVKPQSPTVPSNDFIFTVDGVDYPALLLNLPTPLESHKTFDNKIFLKSADVGQMLQVFLNDKERDLVRSKIVKTVNGEFYSSGISPPTTDIVKRRFELTRKNETHLPYKIKQVCEEINYGIDSVTGGSIFNETPGAGAKRITDSGGDGDAGGPAEQVVMESMVEEVVDFEEWMADVDRPGHGRVLTVHGADWSTPDAQLLQLHPEVLATQVDAEEDALEALALQQLKAEKERAAQALNEATQLLQQTAVDTTTSAAASTVAATTTPTADATTKKNVILALKGTEPSGTKEDVSDAASKAAAAAAEGLRLSLKLKPVVTGSNTGAEGGGLEGALVVAGDGREDEEGEVDEDDEEQLDDNDEEEVDDEEEDDDDDDDDVDMAILQEIAGRSAVVGAATDLTTAAAVNADEEHDDEEEHVEGEGEDESDEMQVDGDDENNEEMMDNDNEDDNDDEEADGEGGDANASAVVDAVADKSDKNGSEDGEDDDDDDDDAWMNSI